MRPPTALLLSDDLHDRFTRAARRAGREPGPLLDEILSTALNALEEPLPIRQCRCCPAGCKRRFTWRGETRCACPPMRAGEHEHRGGSRIRGGTDKRYTLSVTPQTYQRLYQRATDRGVPIGRLIDEMLDLEDRRAAA